MERGLHTKMEMKKAYDGSRWYLRPALAAVMAAALPACISTSDGARRKPTLFFDVAPGFYNDRLERTYEEFDNPLFSDHELIRHGEDFRLNVYLDNPDSLESVLGIDEDPNNR